MPRISITIKDLRARVDHLNRVLGKPLHHSVTNSEGKYLHAAVGNFHLEGAYGGWKLVQIVNEAGGVRDISTGYRSKREVYEFLNAYLDGIHEGVKTEQLAALKA